MAVEKISIDIFIALAPTCLVVDVRSPSEYRQAHYPTAVSIPLFDDEERKEVGTTYKKQSREDAIKIGLDFYGPKMKGIIHQVEKLLDKNKDTAIIVHCWRGGMRSAAIAWLLDLYGCKVFQLTGGYKTYRNWVLETLGQTYDLRILSGYTGSGKTEILQQLEKKGFPIVDLEKIAKHKGSTFGNLKHVPQGSNEFFENRLANKLHEINSKNTSNHPIWVESESSRIGEVSINSLFFNQMKQAPKATISVPFEERLKYIIAEYGKEELDELTQAVERLHKRLGGLETKRTIDFLKEGNIESAFAILLHYYDRFYDRNTLYQKDALKVDVLTTDAIQNTEKLLKKAQENGFI